MQTLTRPPYLLTGLFYLAISFSSSAQMPTIKTDGKESHLVFLEKLNVSVNISGSIATTTWTMTFKNTTARVLEGELNFPLPQGVSVSRYSVDINGKLREAVPVEKEKATLIFENTERRRVDPGLLEKVDGNGFRTRIYPINPNSTRTVLIGYDQDLSRDGQSAVLYRLPLAFQFPIAEFTIHIDVFGVSTRPVFDENTHDALQFDEWRNSWTASHHWKDYRADQSIEIRIPKMPGVGEASMQQSGNHYFYVVNAFPEQKKIKKELPRKITLLWDASLSGLSRDVRKELSLLDAYFYAIQQSEITLVTFSNAVQAPQSFSVRNGQWQSLRQSLQNTVYDGATQFGTIDLNKYPCDEYLLFSDGHSNFGSDRIRLSSQPLYAIITAPGSDFPFLQNMVNISGGECVNLENCTVEQAKVQLLYKTLHFLGVRHSVNLDESYPSVSTPVINGITVAGISYQPSLDLVLQFGYDGRVVSEQTIPLDFRKQKVFHSDAGSPPDIQLDLSRIWAQMKIAQLDCRYEDNKAEIELLGKRHGIVTRNTSLIVLETVEDYVTYRVEPPAELRDEYDRIVKERGHNEQQARREVENSAEIYFNELLKWWQTDFRGLLLSPRERAKKINRETATQDEDQSVGNGHLSRQDTPPSSPVLEHSIVGMAAGIQVDREHEPSARMSEAKSKSINSEDNVVFDGSFTAWKAEAHIDYLDKLKAAKPAERYARYLQLRKEFRMTPLFYFHSADLFISSGDRITGLRILSNIAEIDVENYELYKMLGYKLKEIGEAEGACSVFRKVLGWRPFEPQSYRDYGLALEDAGHYQQALDTLYLALIKNYDINISALYPGIEETIIPEINNLILRAKGKIDISRVPKNILSNMPVDIRVVLNWNMNNTDIDLWVTDPNDEKCYYSHHNTLIGGRISQDFTMGLGPEQFLIKKAVKGKYKVEVNYYGDTQMKLAGATTIMVEVFTGYGLSSQTRRLMTMQMLPGSNGAVFVGEFEFK